MYITVGCAILRLVEKYTYIYVYIGVHDSGVIIIKKGLKCVTLRAFYTSKYFIHTI
jgi:hypothetical protein